MFNNRGVEALFGGVLALVVLGVAIYAVANTDFGGRDLDGASSPAVTTMGKDVPIIRARAGRSLVCECYHDAFSLAGDVNSVSPQFRTGFEQCRARAGQDGSDAWMAGWHARENARPYEASCKSYKRKSKS